MPRRIHINVVAVLIVVFLALLVIGLASILSPRSAGASPLQASTASPLSDLEPQVITATFIGGPAVINVATTGQTTIYVQYPNGFETIYISGTGTLTVSAAAQSIWPQGYNFEQVTIMGTIEGWHVECVYSWGTCINMWIRNPVTVTNIIISSDVVTQVKVRRNAMFNTQSIGMLELDSGVVLTKTMFGYNDTVFNLPTDIFSWTFSIDNQTINQWFDDSSAWKQLSNDTWTRENPLPPSIFSVTTTVHDLDVYQNNTTFVYTRTTHGAAPLAQVDLNWGTSNYRDYFLSTSEAKTQTIEYHQMLEPGYYTLTAVFTEGTYVTSTTSYFRVETSPAICYHDLTANEVIYASSGCTFGGDVSISDSSSGPWKLLYHSIDGQGAVTHLNSNMWVMARGSTGVSTRDTFDAATEMLNDGCGNLVTGCDSVNVFIAESGTVLSYSSAISKMSITGNRDSITVTALYAGTIDFTFRDGHTMGYVFSHFYPNQFDVSSVTTIKVPKYWHVNVDQLQGWSCDLPDLTCRKLSTVYLPMIFR